MYLDIVASETELLVDDQHNGQIWTHRVLTDFSQQRFTMFEYVA